MKKQNIKVDQGFELIYWRLSYRRKLIRSLWIFPSMIIVSLILFLYLGLPTRWIVLYTAISTIAGIIQIIYNNQKWKQTTMD